jgi:hypothetical protein
MRRLLAALTVLALVVPAGAAAARKRPYVFGKYAGTTAQANPDTQSPLAISFTVRRGRIVKVKFTVLEQCDNGAQLLTTDSFDGPVKVKRNRRFAYLVSYTNGARALFKGKVSKHGKVAGTISADGDHNQAGANCAHAGAVKFTAKH